MVTFEGSSEIKFFRSLRLVFVSTSSGLWKSLDGENWAKLDPAIEQSMLNQRQILTNVVYAAKIDDRD